MKIQFLLEKVLTGKKVKFSSAVADSSGYYGNKIIKVTDILEDKHFYIYHSLVNYVRFKEWVGKEAMADIQILKKKPIIKTTEGEKLYPIEINTEVEIEKKYYKDNKEQTNWDNEL